MANLREAFEYAAQNPDSQVYRDLVNMSQTGLLDAEAKKFGINLEPMKQARLRPVIEQDKGVLGTLGDVGKGVLKGFGTTVRGASELGGKILDATGGRIGAELGEMTGGAKVEDTLAKLSASRQQGLDTMGLSKENLEAKNTAQSVGKGAEQLFEILGTSLVAPEITAGKVAGKMPSILKFLAPSVDDAIQAGANELIKTGGDIKDSLEVAALGGAGGAALRTLGKGASVIGKTAKEGLENITAKVGVGTKNILPEEAINSIRQNLTEQLYGKQSLGIKLDKAQSDIIDTISANPRYLPDVDVENKAFNTRQAFDNLKADISQYSDELRGLFQKADTVDGGLPTKEVIGDAFESLQKLVANPRYAGLDDTILNQPLKTLENLQVRYPNTIPRADLWEVRKGIDDAINSLSDTNIQKELRTQVRKAFASSLEKIPNDEAALVSRSMDELQKLIEVRDFIDPTKTGTLSGAKIQGGKLTDLIRNQLGGQVGAMTGAAIGGIGGGPVGAIVGYSVSSKLGQWLAKNTLSNPSERKALTDYIAENPKVFDEIKEYVGKNIQSMTDEEAGVISKNLQKLEDEIPPQSFNSASVPKTDTALRGIGNTKVNIATGLSTLAGAEAMGYTNIVPDDIFEGNEETYHANTTPQIIEEISEAAEKKQKVYNPRPDQKRGGTDRPIEITDKDIDELAAILYSEIGNRSEDKQYLEAQTIVNVILNRMINNKDTFKNKTAYELVTDPKEIQGYGTPQYKKYKSGEAFNDKNPVNINKINAIKKALEDLKNGALENNIGDDLFYVHYKDDTIRPKKDWKAMQEAIDMGLIK